MRTVKRGDRISEYVLGEPVGRGAFGEVWRARHHQFFEREVAIKIPVSPEAVRDLAHECSLRAGLDHPGIAKTLGVDVTADPPYFVTEFVSGENLRDTLVARAPLPVGEARRILLDTLEILQYAHERGVVHQDIKPENILLTDQGEVKITDFGLGGLTTGDSLALSVSLRSEPVVGGTIAYIAPELRDRTGAVDGRADLYSMGIVFFEMLTGSRPAGRDLPSELRPGLPRWCDRVFKGLYARVDRRFSSSAEVRRSIGARPPEARVTPLCPPTRRLIDQRDVRRILGFSQPELEDCVRRGHFRAYTVGGRRRFDRNELESYRRQNPSDFVRSKPTRMIEAGERSPKAQTVKREAGQSLTVPAGFWSRTLAMVVDLWVVAALQSALTVPLVFFPPLIAPQYLVFCFVYFSVCTGTLGQTLGKYLLSLKVVRSDGRPLTVLHGAMRTINYGLSFLPFGMGFVMAGMNRRKLAAHDWICSTRVVCVKAEFTPLILKRSVNRGVASASDGR